jgi:ABC-type nitrate/sulfonate/bicarbonate transport system ATPase subunit
MSNTEIAEGTVLLSLKDVCLRLGHNQILDKVSFEVKNRQRPNMVTGQIVGLLGPSGVGKTRIIRLISGLDIPDAGSIRGIEGKLLTAGTVGVVFQNYPLLRHRTVFGNLLVAGIAAGLSHKESKTRADDLLNQFRLSERGDFYPAQLSGGQRQRAAIAQQLMRPKQLLLMDEPFSGLDPAALEALIHLLIEVRDQHDLNTIIVVTHDIRASLIVSDTLFTLGRDRDAEGKITPGAKIQERIDLVEEGLAWRKDVEFEPKFTTREREIKAKFHTL